MTTKQKLELRASELRATLNDFASAEEALTEEETTQLDEARAEYRDVETKLRAAITAEGEESEKREKRFELDDGEGAEIRQLAGRVAIGEYMQAAVEGRVVAGAESEFNLALEFKRPNGFPLRLLAPEVRANGTEERATTNTDGQATQSGRWLDRLFAIAAARHLGVTFESVNPGLASFPITTAGASGKQQDRSEVTGDAAWEIGVTELKPKRNSVRAIFNMEDDMRVPGLEAGLRRDLGLALADAVDASIFKGDTGPSTASYDITGLQTASGVTQRTISQALKVTGAGAAAAFAGYVDGKHAARMEDLRIVLSVGANTLWCGTLVQAGNNVDRSIKQFLNDQGLSWMVRADIDANTAANDFGGYVGLGRGIEGAAVAAIWSEGQLTRDPYSGAASGTVALNLQYYWDFGLPRASSFGRVKFVA